MPWRGTIPHHSERHFSPALMDRHPSDFQDPLLRRDGRRWQPLDTLTHPKSRLTFPQDPRSTSIWIPLLQRLEYSAHQTMDTGDPLGVES